MWKSSIYSRIVTCSFRFKPSSVHGCKQHGGGVGRLGSRTWLGPHWFLGGPQHRDTNCGPGVRIGNSWYRSLAFYLLQAHHWRHRCHHSLPFTWVLKEALTATNQCIKMPSEALRKEQILQCSYKTYAMLAGWFYLLNLHMSKLTINVRDAKSHHSDELPVACCRSLELPKRVLCFAFRS